MSKRLTKKALRRKVNHTFGDAAEAYRMMLHLEGRLTRDTENRIARLEERWASALLSEITPQAWQSYVYNTWSNATPSTMARNLSVMRAILRHTESLGWLFDAPQLKTPRYKDTRNTHLEKEEIVPLVEYVRQRYSPLYAFCILLLTDTGVRFGEMINLRWCDVDGQTIRVRRQKGKGNWNTKTVERDIPMSPRLLEFMGRWKILPDTSDPEFTPQQKIVQSRWNETVWTIGRKLNGALREGAMMTGARAAADIRVHDLRHTFAFLCAKAGADLADIRDLLGHTNISMTMRYRGFVKSRAVAAIQEMGATQRQQGVTT